MMPYQQTIARVRRDLDDTFAQIDTWFDLSADVRSFSPAEGVWSVDEILEHITLTNHFLMMTLRNSRDLVLRRAKTQPISQIADAESDLDKILRIGDPDAFGWIRPAHMEPTRTVTSEQVRQRMRNQHAECQQILDSMANGEGALHHVRMSVQDLGKLDLYEWLYFLVQHAKRHLVEMERLQVLYAETV